VLPIVAITESAKQLLYPKAEELIAGAIAFTILFVFMAKWVFPQINKILEARRQKIQGDLEKAEQTKAEAEHLLADYREQLSSARDEANRIIEEARKTADSLRKDIQAKAEQEAQGTIARAQEEIRGERDRVFQELKSQVAELSVALAGRMVGATLDKDRQLSLVDSYIRELGAMSGNGNGHGSAGSEE
jgi:F-type H+-transporting ATPase subunit b